MRITKTIGALLLLLGLLASCNQGEGSSFTTTSQAEKEDGDNKNPVVLTQQMTPTPVLPADKIPMGGGDRPGGNHGGNQGGNQDKPSAVLGEGAELEGYTQLLKYIDRDSIAGPAAWGRHVVGEMLDGLFESTDAGSNKYGQDISNAEVYWQMTSPVVLNAYTMYTANDTDQYPGRNPRAWTIYGSNDGKDWKVVHSVKDASLPIENYAPIVFEFDNTQAYSYYSWVLDAVVDGNAFQLSELLLYTAEEIKEPIEGEGLFFGKLPTEKLTENGKDADPEKRDFAIAWMDAHESLADKVDQSSPFVNAQCWENEGPARLFDGIYTADEFAVNESGKMGGNLDSCCVVWKMTEQVTPTGYVLVTGNDTDEYPARNPIAWVLYGSNDGKTWEALDIVGNSNMLGESFAPHVYILENSGSYEWFCLSVEVTAGSMQLCEIILMK